MATAGQSPEEMAEEPEDYADQLPRIPSLTPREALESLSIVPGFRVELAACEPLVSDPVAVAFDEQGRLFVVEMRGYSEDRDQRLGRVRLLTDTDADGVFDQATDYVDELEWPTAVACYDGGVFIGAAPDILYCKDTDGDGRADLRETVFTGFLHHNVQGLLNSFQWGVDNRIHGSASTCGGQVQRVGDGETAALSLRGRDFSFDPRKLDLRAESGGAQHGLSFDRWGRKFVCSNSDHLQAVLIADRYFARNPYYAAPGARESIAADGPQAEVYRRSPVEPWRIVRTRLRVAGAVPGPVEGGGRAAGYFTGASGATIYTGDAWPAEYQTATWAFIGDVGSNIVHRKRVDARGTSFVGRRVDPEREFLASTDIWFRPAQFCNGPDGCLYVLDVYREVIEHPASLPPRIKRHLDLTSGRDRGRIYRIVPEGVTPRRTNSLAEATTGELVAALAHANAWHRRTAARLLCERQSVIAVEALAALAVDDAQSYGQMHALHVLRQLGRLDEATVSQALGATHARVREHAVALCEDFITDETAEAWLARLTPLADDDDPRVRFQLALTAGALPGELPVRLLPQLLARDGGDHWTRVAVLTSSAGCAPELLDNLESLPDATWLGGFRKQLQAVVAAHTADQGRAFQAQATTLATERVVEPLRHPPSREPLIAEYRQALVDRENTADDLSRGQELFQKHCAVCHDVGTGQGGLGPNLATMKARGADAILTNVLDPNREVNPQFVNYVVELDDGRAFTGIITAETATSLTLAKGRDEQQTVLKIAVETMQSSGKSLMPEDFDKQLSPTDMRQLIAFLLTAE